MYDTNQCMILINVMAKLRDLTLAYIFTPALLLSNKAENE